MKKILILILSIFLLTACSMDSLKEDINNIKDRGDCAGRKENGQCCTADYSGQDVDASGHCPGAQVPGDQVYPKQDEKRCYIVVCEDMEK